MFFLSDLLAEALQSLGSVKKISQVNRRIIYKLVSHCRDMAGGVYPLALPVSNEEEEDYALDPGQAIVDLQVI